MAPLILGTAQFGLDYGVANSGQVSPLQVGDILSAAEQLGIRTLDTAAAYGNSEAVLAQHQATRRFQVISKLSPQQAGTAPLLAQFEQRCAQLDGIPEAVLFHRADDLLTHPHADDHWRAAEQARTQGLCRKIGVSLYHPNELRQLLQRYPLQLVQLPANWLDQRFLAADLLQQLTAAGVEIHARSLLLQGVLLQPPAARPAYFRQFAALAAFDDWVAACALPPATVALSLLSHYPQLSAVVGCVSVAQLKQLVAAITSPPPVPPAAWPPADDALILPYLWPEFRR